MKEECKKMALRFDVSESKEKMMEIYKKILESDK